MKRLKIAACTQNKRKDIKIRFGRGYYLRLYFGSDLYIKYWKTGGFRNEKRRKISKRWKNKNTGKDRTKR